MPFPLHQPNWQHHRVIHSKYPPIDVFDSEDSLLLAELEGATSDRLANWSRYIHPNDLQTGPGWSPVNAAFCYASNGRFNTVRRGAYYAGDSIETALKEWSFHTAQVWHGFRLSAEVSAVVRSYTGQILKPLVDVRGKAEFMQDRDYAPGQALAETLYNAGESGILYTSVRHPGAEAVALLRANATSPVTQSSHYVLKWNGNRFTGYARMDEFHAL